MVYNFLAPSLTFTQKTFCGTPNYAAVELISGIPYVGVKSDIWAMGIVLFIMATGHPPFSGQNISALYSKIKAVDYKCPEYFSKGKLKVLGRRLILNFPPFFFRFGQGHSKNANQGSP
jgi:serine/threonine protein kinase